MSSRLRRTTFRIRRPSAAAVASLASGLALALAYPDFNWPWMSLVALVPWGLALEQSVAADPARRRWGRMFFRGWLLGVGLFGLGLFWIARLPLKELTQPWILVPAHLLLVSYLSCFTGLAGLAYLALRRAGLTPGLALAAALLAGEQLRSMGELGFPWMALGYAWYRHPVLLQCAAWGAAAAVSLWVAAVNGLLLEAVLAALRGRAGRATALAACGAALVAAVAWSGQAALRTLPEYPRLRVALIQPNIGSDVKWDPRYLQANLQVHLDLTRAVAARRPQLIIWPETAVPSYLRYDAAAFHAVQSVAREVRTPLLTGFPDWRSSSGSLQNGSAYNSAAVIGPDGRFSQLYDKVHLVPFGERMPFQRWLPWLGKMDFGQAEFVAGTSSEPLPAGPARLGVLVCFESIFTEPSASEVRSGANLLVNITNDEWFGPHAAPWQHASMSVLRAVENRTGLARCANTGVSFLVDPGGRISQPSGLFERATVVGDVELGRGGTFVTRHGPWLGRTLLGLTLLAAAWGLRRRGPGPGIPRSEAPPLESS